VDRRSVAIGAFSQVGTVENRNSANGNDQYYAFGVIPQAVPSALSDRGEAGDSVEARMTLYPDGWSLALDDTTSGKARTIQTNYGANDQFNSCEWFQENPSMAIHSHQLPDAFDGHVSRHGSQPLHAPVQLPGCSDPVDVQRHLLCPDAREKASVFAGARDGQCTRIFDRRLYRRPTWADFFESATQGIEPGNIATNSYIAGLGLDLPILQSETWPKHVAKACLATSPTKTTSRPICRTG